MNNSLPPEGDAAMSGLIVPWSELEVLMGDRRPRKPLLALHDMTVIYIFDNGDVATFCRALDAIDTQESRLLSRLVGIRFAREAMEFGLKEEFKEVCSSYLDRCEALIRNGRSLRTEVSMMKSLRSIANAISHSKMDELPYFALSAATDLLMSCDAEPEPYISDEELDTYAPDAAWRCYEACVETIYWTENEVRGASRVAEAAMQGERQWRKGTDTKFDLVEAPIRKILDEILEERRCDEELKELIEEKLRMLIEPVIKEFRHG